MDKNIKEFLDYVSLRSKQTMDLFDAITNNTNKDGYIKLQHIADELEAVGYFNETTKTQSDEELKEEPHYEPITDEPEQWEEIDYSENCWENINCSRCNRIIMIVDNNAIYRGDFPDTLSILCLECEENDLNSLEDDVIAEVECQNKECSCHN